MGNLLKNLSPIAGAALGGPGGMLLAGAMSGTGDLARGKHVGVGSAFTNAAMGGGLGALKSAFMPSSAVSYGAGDVAKGALMEGRDALLHGAKALGTKDGLMMAGNVAGGVMDARESNARTGLYQQQFDLQKQQHDEQEQRRRQLQQLLQPLLASYAPGGV